MNLLNALLFGATLGAIGAIGRAIDIIVNPPPPELPPAVRRAMREDCRRKGL